MKTITFRCLDLLIAVPAILIFSIPMIIVAVLIAISSKGPVIFWSERMGQNLKPFLMPKFRTMSVDTPLLPSANLEEVDKALTPIGRFLRLTSFDELPQLFCIVIGTMSCVGPRPVLCSQRNLINLRHALGAYEIKPGLTGWAQVNGRDNLTDTQKAHLDAEYYINMSMSFYLKIVCLTFVHVLSRKNISH